MMSSRKKGVHFFGKGMAKNVRERSSEEKRRTKRVNCKIKIQIIFIIRLYCHRFSLKFLHPFLSLHSVNIYLRFYVFFYAVRSSFAMLCSLFCHILLVFYKDVSLFQNSFSFCLLSNYCSIPSSVFNLSLGLLPSHFSVFYSFLMIVASTFLRSLPFTLSL